MAELQRIPVAGAAPPRRVHVLEEPPSLSRGSVPSPRRPLVDPERKIGEFGEFGGSKPKSGAPRWVLPLVLLLLLLSGVLWATLHIVTLREQQEMREELQLLRERNSGDWTEAWETLAHIQSQQEELSRITELLCRAVEDSKKCPQDWQFYRNSCYYFSSMSRSWDSARSFCREAGADLVVVSTEEEQLFLVKELQGNNTYWMGVTDKQHKGKWTWLVGKSPTFGFWDVWEEDPDKKQKDCGMMKPNGRWTNERCSKSSHWICERSWDCNFSPLLPISQRFAPED